VTPNPHEYHRTPGWCVDRLLERIRLPARHRTWCDPCAGDGAIIDAVPGHLYEQVKQYDIQPRADHVMQADFLELEAREALADVMIFNPPFSKAVQFVSKAQKCAGMVICLQRLNWLASDKRAGWLAGWKPSVYVLPNRPSFSGNGKTDSADYAWFVWDTSFAHTVEILDVTPKEVRRATR